MCSIYLIFTLSTLCPPNFISFNEYIWCVSLCGHFPKQLSRKTFKWYQSSNVLFTMTTIWPESRTWNTLKIFDENQSVVASSTKLISSLHGTNQLIEQIIWEFNSVLFICLWNTCIYYTPTLLYARITHFQHCTITQSIERISGQIRVFARILRFCPHTAFLPAYSISALSRFCERLLHCDVIFKRIYFVKLQWHLFIYSLSTKCISITMVILISSDNSPFITCIPPGLVWRLCLGLILL